MKNFRMRLAAIAAAFLIPIAAIAQFSPPPPIAGGGTVTSVGLSLPSFLTVTGSPVISNGTLTGALASQSANTAFIAPNGSSGAPTFRALVAADLPTVTVAKGGTNATSASGTALDNITGFSTTGIMRRTGVGTYTMGTVVSVAEGGTNSTSASGTALDNITGFSTTGIMRRTGAGTYTMGTQVATAEIANQAVTAAQIANATITTTQIAAGAVSTAQLATPAASGASLVLLGSNTVSGAATLPLNGFMSSTYAAYKIILVNGIPSTASGATLGIQLGNGGTYGTANYHSMINIVRDDASTGVIGTSTASFFGGIGVDNNAGGGASGEVIVYNPSDTTNYKKVAMDFVGNASSLWYSAKGMGAYINVPAVTDIRFSYSSGNISGTAYIYGIRPN